jgi:putative membrane protein
MLVGALAEAAAIAFTDSYEYPGYHLYVGPVPLFVAVGWSANFYYTHGIATVLSGRHRDGPLGLWLLGLLGGLCGVLIDLCFDPVAVSLGWWVWQGGSGYFGVPVANFVGWFSLCAGFSFAYGCWARRPGLRFAQRTLLFYLLLLAAFLVTALVSFPFL